MTKPINLYIQSRIKDELSFNRVELHSSKRQDCGKTKEHEIGSLRKIVDAFIAQGLSPKELDGFFFGFHIPQIGKEFDLLKFSQTEVINIEFKSQSVPEEQILTQLIKNKHYLAHLGKEEFLYTIITDTMTCYELCADNSIAEAQMLIDYFRKNDYVFINYSKSNLRYSPYSQYEEDYDTHHVIGQEFDNVLILMDKSFYYDDDGVLQGIPHPTPDYLYPNLFYQGISRVREKIALIVVDDPVLFEKITSVLENED